MTQTVSFEPTADQRDIAALAREIAVAEIAPHIAQWDREHYFPRPLFTMLADVGLMGVLVPEVYGGVDAGYGAYALVIEELSRIDAGVGVTVSVHGMVCRAITLLGSTQQRESYLPGLVCQDIAAFALTESESGSDSASIRATAQATKNGWRLYGRKQWCTNGSYARVIMAMFRTAMPGAHGISAFLVPMDTAGVRIERVTEKLGIRTSNTADIAFEDAEIAQDALLGAENEGYRTALGILSAGRIGIAAQACGILQAALEASLRFAHERRAFGKAIIEFEGVSFKLARMATDLEAARLLTYRAAALADAGASFVKEASMAKLFASKAAVAGTNAALQIHGGYGYTTEFPVERYYRDAKITEIYEGTSEIQHIVIAKHLLPPG